MTRMALVVALVSLAPARSPAQGTPPPQPPAKSSGAEAAKPPQRARDLARALTSKQTWDGILDSYTASLFAQMSGALTAKGRQPPDGLREKVRADLEEAVPYDQALDMHASALAIRFSENELSEIERFYRSAAGKKLLDVLPEVSQQVNEELRERLAQRIAAIVERHVPELAAGEEEPATSGEGAKQPAKPEPKAHGRRPPAGETTSPRP